jgi:hypothetical protein
MLLGIASDCFQQEGVQPFVQVRVLTRQVSQMACALVLVPNEATQGVDECSVIRGFCTLDWQCGRRRDELYFLLHSTYHRLKQRMVPPLIVGYQADEKLQDVI